MQMEEQEGVRAFVEGLCNQGPAADWRVVLDLPHGATGRDVRGKASCSAPHPAPLHERMLLPAERFRDWLVRQPNSSGYQLAKGMPCVLRSGKSFTLQSLDKPIFSRHF